MSAKSIEAKTGLAGFSTGRLLMALQTYPQAAGDYAINVSLDEGNTVTHRLRTAKVE